MYVAFVLDVFNHELVGWKAAKNMRPELVFDALEQASGLAANPAV